MPLTEGSDVVSILALKRQEKKEETEDGSDVFWMVFSVPTNVAEVKGNATKKA